MPNTPQRPAAERLLILVGHWFQRLWKPQAHIGPWGCSQHALSVRGFRSQRPSSTSATVVAPSEGLLSTAQPVVKVCPKWGLPFPFDKSFDQIAEMRSLLVFPSVHMQSVSAPAKKIWGVLKILEKIQMSIV